MWQYEQTDISQFEFFIFKRLSNHVVSEKQNNFEPRIAYYNLLTTTLFCETKYKWYTEPSSSFSISL